MTAVSTTGMCNMMRSPKSTLKKKAAIGSANDSTPNPFVAPSTGARPKVDASDFGFGPKSSQVHASGKGMSAVPGLCVPTPSEFRAATLGHRSSAASQMRALESASGSKAPVSASASSSNMMTTASKTRLEKHARQMRAIQRMQPKGFPKNDKIPQWPHGNPLVRMLSRMRQTWQKPEENTNTTDPAPLTPEETRHVVREFDRDVAEAILSVGGHLMGISPAELSQSTGMRILVARNIRWFQNTPDCIKLMGLMAAKKMNNILVKRGYSTMSLDNMPTPIYTCWDHLPERAGEPFTPEAIACGKGHCQIENKKTSKTKTTNPKTCKRSKTEDTPNVKASKSKQAAVKKSDAPKLQTPKKTKATKAKSAEDDVPKQKQPRKSKEQVSKKQRITSVTSSSAESLVDPNAVNDCIALDTDPPALVSDALAM